MKRNSWERTARRRTGSCREAGKMGFVHGRQEGQEMQLPAVFLLDGTGVILYAHYAKTIADLPTVDQIMKKIQR